MNVYLNEMFGIPLNIISTDAPLGLPIYMTAGRVFYHVEYIGIRFLLVGIVEHDRFGVVALEKQLVKYMDVCGMNTAYLMSDLTKIQRDALTSRMIPFIAPPDQIFLPFLGVSLSNRFVTQKKISVEKFSPSSQCLFLYFLYNPDKKNISKKDAADAIGLTRMSVTRASNQLLAMGLIREEKAGKETRMIPVAFGKDYYEMGKAYLTSPVSKVKTVRAEKQLLEQPVAGESLLAERSMLNSPKLTVVAVKDNDNLLDKLIEGDERWETDAQHVRVEIWKYDPLLFSNDGFIDPISMALSLSSVSDERVQGELAEYMESIKW